MFHASHSFVSAPVVVGVLQASPVVTRSGFGISLDSSFGYRFGEFSQVESLECLPIISYNAHSAYCLVNQYQLSECNVPLHKYPAVKLETPEEDTYLIDLD